MWFTSLLTWRTLRMQRVGSSIYQELDALVDSKRESFINLLQELVQCPAPSWPDVASTEANAQDVVAAKLESLSLKALRWIPELGTLRKHPDFKDYPADYAQRPCISAVLPGSDPTCAAVTLHGHADVVGPGDVDKWLHPPFGAVIEKGKLYGRGAADARGSLATFLAALEAVVASGTTLKGDVNFVSVADEEGGGNGTLSYVDAGLGGDVALVGEPTGLALCPGSRGATSFRMRVHGRPAHSGVAYEGENAIVKAAAYVQALHELQFQLDRESRHPLWETLPVAHAFNIATIEGGRFVGVVPDRCDISVIAGCIGGESVSFLKRRVMDTINRVTAKDPWLQEHPPAISWGPVHFEPSAIPGAHAVVLILGEAYQGVTGQPPKVHALPAGSDLRHFINAGATPGLHFGPGSMRLGHGENEWIDVEEVMTAVKVVARFLLQWTSLPREQALAPPKGA